MDKFNVVAAGHICLDVIPGMEHLPAGEFGHLFQPGQLISVGPATFSTGGLVSNTGLALFRLGVPIRLVAKVGIDPFGQLVCSLVKHIQPDLEKDLVVDAQAVTSYTLIVNAPGVDRIFLHCSGANDTFGPEDIEYGLVEQAGLFHFGYPPIMRRMYSQGGAELAEVFRKARAAGATTSLDMACPDPSSPGGQVNWREILKASLPLVDIFLPSFEELLFMVDRPLYERMAGRAAHSSLLEGVQPGLLARLAGELIELGVKVVVFKLGERGLYLRTAGCAALSQMGRAAPADLQAWADQELWAPCYQVEVAGTTGSGDSTIAGFLSALLRDFTPRQAVNTAVAVGACNVEAADALSGLRSWDETLARVHQGWARLPLEITAPGWSWCEQDQVWVGPGSSIQGGPDGNLVG